MLSTLIRTLLVMTVVEGVVRLAAIVAAIIIKGRFKAVALGTISVVVARITIAGAAVLGIRNVAINTSFVSIVLARALVGLLRVLTALPATANTGDVLAVLGGVIGCPTERAIVLLCRRNGARSGHGRATISGVGVLEGQILLGCLDTVKDIFKFEARSGGEDLGDHIKVAREVLPDVHLKLRVGDFFIGAADVIAEIDQLGEPLPDGLPGDGPARHELNIDSHPAGFVVGTVKASFESHDHVVGVVKVGDVDASHVVAGAGDNVGGFFNLIIVRVDAIKDGLAVGIVESGFARAALEASNDVPDANGLAKASQVGMPFVPVRSGKKDARSFGVLEDFSI